jgi:hypothetical protein
MPELGTSGSVRGRDGQPPGLLDRDYYRKADSVLSDRFMQQSPCETSSSYHPQSKVAIPTIVGRVTGPK